MGDYRNLVGRGLPWCPARGLFPCRLAPQATCGRSAWTNRATARCDGRMWFIVWPGGIFIGTTRLACPCVLGRAPPCPVCLCPLYGGFVGAQYVIREWIHWRSGAVRGDAPETDSRTGLSHSCLPRPPRGWCSAFAPASTNSCQHSACLSLYRICIGGPPPPQPRGGHVVLGAAK